jgi:DNA-binding MarR family transcriptional regulator
LAEGIEVTPSEAHTLQAIGELESINVTSLGDHFGVTKSAASQIVSKLAKKGFVKKALSEHSGKELRLEMTEMGRQAFEAIQKFRGRHFQDIIKRLGSFSLSQIATAAVLLDVIEDVMDDRLDKR